MVVPANIKVIIDCIDKQQVGSIEVKYNLPVPQAPDDDEYDDDEQLYAAITKTLNDKFTSATIPLFQHKNTLLVSVPHQTNTIAMNILGKALVRELKVENWITLSPCPLNNGQTINKLSTTSHYDSIPEYKMIPSVTPPHFITGVAGKITLELAHSNKLCTLILNAEGQPGYEKLDTDSLVDSSHIIAKILDLDDKYLKAVSLLVRKFNSYSNSGMYI